MFFIPTKCNVSAFYGIFSFWNQCQNSSEDTHIACKTTQKRAWIIQSVTKQRRVTLFRQSYPRSTSLWSCVNDIRSSGMLPDHAHHSAIPLAANIPVQLIYPSNTNLSFLDQGIGTQHFAARQGQSTRKLRKPCIQVPLVSKEQPPPLSL